MTKEEWQAWEKVAKETAWKKFAETVPSGQELLDLATEVARFIRGAAAPPAAAGPAAGDDPLAENRPDHEASRRGEATSPRRAILSSG